MNTQDLVGKSFWHEGSDNILEGCYRVKFYDDEVNMFFVEKKNDSTGEWYDNGWFWKDSVANRVN